MKYFIASLLLLGIATQATAVGNLIKSVAHDSVYLVGEDGKRYVFPNPKVYASWYDDFSGVRTVSDAELSSLPLGGNVTFRPGSMIKIATDPKVYAVDTDGSLRWIETEAAAASIYGPAWAKLVQDVPDYLFADYRVASGSIGINSNYNLAQTVRIGSYWEVIGPRIAAKEASDKTYQQRCVGEVQALETAYDNSVTNRAQASTLIKNTEYIDAKNGLDIDRWIVRYSGLYEKYEETNPCELNVVTEEDSRNANLGLIERSCDIFMRNCRYFYPIQECYLRKTSVDAKTAYEQWRRVIVEKYEGPFHDAVDAAAKALSDRRIECQ